jgi:glutaminyl-tRNA synthetase
LYDWFIEKLEIFPSHQYEFARLNITYTVMSKRKLLELVKNRVVSGWDDPRMPTICGLRRRGYTPESIRNFAERVGVAKRQNTIELSLLENCVREDLNKRAERRLVVVDPLKVVITNYPVSQTEVLPAINNPENPDAGTREITFGRELYIEKNDFMEVPPKKYFRLAPGSEVRLKYAYIIKCEEIIKDDKGEIVELRCSYDPGTKSGSNSTKHVKGTIHWVNVNDALPVEVRLYDRLFTESHMDDIPGDKTYTDYLNPESLTVTTAYAEPSLNDVRESVQFERIGYFYPDYDSRPDKLIFNRTVTLKDSWVKQNKQ